MQCPGCGHENPEDARFCNQCARPLSGAEVPAALEHARKQVSVLFADMKGSMEMLAGRDPEEARSLLDPVLQAMMEAVRHHGGTVNQVMGDGIMALFGAPRAQEDHAVRACCAALRMQAAVAQGTTPSAEGGAPAPRLLIRVGIHSGDVVLRAIDSGLHLDYTAVGETTHLAARMEQAARAGATLITGQTMVLTRGAVQTRALGTIPVAGLQAPVEVHEVIAVRPEPRSLHVRPLGAFVGRDRELQRLREALERAGRGEGAMAIVTGEAGMGKSRLLHEFVHGVQLVGWRVLHVTCASHGKADGYLPMVQLLRQDLGIAEDGDAAAVSQRVASRLVTLDPSLDDCSLPLCALLNALPANSAWSRMALGERRQAIVEAVPRLLLHEACITPLVVIVEDLHSIDADSRAVLAALVEQLQGATLLLLASCRPEGASAWEGGRDVTSLMLEGLPLAEAAELVAALMGSDRTLDGLLQPLVERADGNPLFIEESVAALVETGMLTGMPGAYRAGQRPPRLGVPGTVHAILAARIDALDLADKQLLQAAAVLGNAFAVPLLQRVSGMADGPLQSAVARLAERGFLRADAASTDRWSFKHPLTHDVAYASLLAERRRELHARVVEAIEAMSARHVEEKVELLAHHASRGRLGDKAAAYLRLAATRALTRSANRDAIAFLEEAAATLDGLPETRDRLAAELEIDVQLAALLRETEGDAAAGVGRCCLRALTLSETLDERACRRAILHTLWAWHDARGDYPQALASAARLRDEIEPGDAAWRQRALRATAISMISAGRPAEALAGLGAAPSPDPSDLTGSLACLAAFAVGQWLVGEVDAARHAAVQCVNQARAAGRSSGTALAHYVAAFVHYQRGERGTALMHAKAARSVGQGHGVGDLAAHASILVARLIVEEGRAEEAVRLLEEHPPWTAGAAWPWTASVSHALAADAWGRAGHPDRGHDMLRVLPPDACTGLYGAELHRLRASLLLAVDPGAGGEAEAWLREALSLAQQRGLRSWALRASISLAYLLARRDRRAARATLSVVDSFAVGADTADVRTARALRQWLR